MNRYNDIKCPVCGGKMDFCPKTPDVHNGMLERYFYFLCPNCLIKTREAEVTVKIDNKANVSSDNSELEKLISELRKEK